MNLLIPNLGSTSLKYQILEMPSEKVLARGRMERVTDYREAIAQVRMGEAAIDAVGSRPSTPARNTAAPSSSIAA